MDSPVVRRRLVITVHGIRTFGQWQERLEALLRERDPGVRAQHYKYGYFSCLAFMVPLFRWWVTRRFRRALVAATADGEYDRIDVVAHSFGTHLVAWGLHGIPRGKRPKIHTVILAGSVLKPSFPWRELTGDCVGRVVNDCGTKDSVLVLNQAVVLFTGMAGRVGFAGMSHERFRNRFFTHGHSGYFLSGGRASDEFMRTWWMPVLLADGPLAAPEDPRDASPLHGIVAFALNNAEPVKLAVYLAPFVFLTILFFSLYRQADRERAQARRRLVDLQVANAERRSDEGDLATALVWHAEAMRSGGELSERDQRVRLATTLRQHPALTQILFLEDWMPREAEFDAEGSLLAIAGGYSGKEGARVWDVATGDPTTPVLAHSNSVTSIAFSPNGKRLATASRDHTARVWDARTGAPLSPPLQHDAQLTRIRFSPDGERVLTVGEGSSTDGVFRASVWLVDSGRLVTAALSHESTIGDAAFSPDGAHVVTLDEDGTARIWDAITGGPACPAIQASRGDADLDGEPCVAFRADGKQIVTSSEGEVGVWDAGTGAPIAGPWLSNGCRLVEFLDADTVLAMDGRGGTTFWSVRRGTSLFARAHGGAPAVSISLSGADSNPRSMVLARNDGSARVWELTEETPSTPRLLQSGAVQSARIDGKARHLATIDVTGLVRVWDLSSDPALVLEHGSEFDAPGLWSASFSPDGVRVLTVVREMNAALMWDAATGESIFEFSHAHTDALECARFSPDGGLVVTASKRGSVRVWSVRNGQEVGAEMKHRSAVLTVSFSPDASRIVTGCEDGSAHVWSVSTREELCPEIDHAPPIVAAQFSPDGRSVLIAGGASAKLYDTASGERLTDGPRQNELGLACAALSPDGRRIASGGMDGVARIWDAATGEAVTPPLVHSGGPKYANFSQQVRHCEFSPDSKLLATSSADGTTRLWDGVTGAAAAPPLIGGDQYATFSPDGRWIATAGSSGAVRVWDARTGAALSPSMMHGYVATHVEFDPQGLRLVSASLDGSARIWNLAPDDRPPDQLRRIAEVLAARRIDDSGGLVELTGEELRSRWESLRKEGGAAGAQR